MTKGGSSWTDEHVETVIGRLLRTGVIIAALVVFIGGVFYLFQYGRAHPDYRIFRGEPSDLRTLRGIAQDASGLHSRGLIQLGLLLLIATPIARVAFSIVAFFRQRDYTYVILTIIVFMILLFSFLGGGF